MCDSRQPTDGAGSDARVTCACPYKGQRRVHYEWCEFRASNRRNASAQRALDEFNAKQG